MLLFSQLALQRQLLQDGCQAIGKCACAAYGIWAHITIAKI